VIRQQHVLLLGLLHSRCAIGMLQRLQVVGQVDLTMGQEQTQSSTHLIVLQLLRVEIMSLLIKLIIAFVLSRQVASLLLLRVEYLVTQML
jgi:hypothetical protein